MSLIELNTTPTDRQLRQFAGQVVPLAALVVIAFLWWHGVGWAWLGAVAIGTSALAMLGTFCPTLVRPIYLGWVVAAYPLGWIVGHVVMGAIFFLIVTPLALVMRVLDRDPLQRQFDPNRTSYWEPRDEQTEARRYFKQF
jgi:hypothetical protein